MDSDLTYLSIKILGALYTHDASSIVNSLTKNELCEKIDSSASATYKHIRLLKSKGYVAEGYRDKTAIKYYITKNGIEFFENNLKNN
jgi:predicted transcriptional regulator